MFFQNMKYRHSVYRRFKKIMRFYPEGVDRIFTKYPNIGEIVEKHRKRGKTPEVLALYTAALIITRELPLVGDVNHLTMWIQLKNLKVKELLDLSNRVSKNNKSTATEDSAVPTGIEKQNLNTHYVGWALYSGKRMLNEGLIDAEEYRLFSSEIQGELANLVSEDQRAGRIKMELDGIDDLPSGIAGKQLAAEVRLGINYLTGDGVEQDDAEALKHLKPAAEQRNVYAETLLAGMYENGYGVARDHKEAVKWYRLAALQGYAEAQLGLGCMYLKGHGVPQDDAEALRWFRFGAEQGHDPTQVMLGAFYEHGRRDYVRAHMWYSLAAARGNEPAITDRDLLAEKMTPDQISESQRLAGEWEPKSQP
jgi:TPR repeat protein